MRRARFWSPELDVLLPLHEMVVDESEACEPRRPDIGPLRFQWYIGVVPSFSSDAGS